MSRHDDERQAADCGSATVEEPLPGPRPTSIMTTSKNAAIAAAAIDSNFRCPYG